MMWMSDYKVSIWKVFEKYHPYTFRAKHKGCELAVEYPAFSCNKNVWAIFLNLKQGIIKNHWPWSKNSPPTKRRNHQDTVAVHRSRNVGWEDVPFPDIPNILICVPGSRLCLSWAWSCSQPQPRLTARTSCPTWHHDDRLPSWSTAWRGGVGILPHRILQFCGGELSVKCQFRNFEMMLPQLWAARVGHHSDKDGVVEVLFIWAHVVVLLFNDE